MPCCGARAKSLTAALWHVLRSPAFSNSAFKPSRKAYCWIWFCYVGAMLMPCLGINCSRTMSAYTHVYTQLALCTRCTRYTPGPNLELGLCVPPAFSSCVRLSSLNTLWTLALARDSWTQRNPTQEPKRTAPAACCLRTAYVLLACAGLCSSTTFWTPHLPGTH